MKKKDVLNGLVCRSCGKSLTLSVVEEEYDFEISCFNCGDLWWIEKEASFDLTGEDLKYISYTSSQSKQSKKNNKSE